MHVFIYELKQRKRFDCSWRARCNELIKKKNCGKNHAHHRCLSFRGPVRTNCRTHRNARRNKCYSSALARRRFFCFSILPTVIISVSTTDALRVARIANHAKLDDSEALTLTV